MRDVKRRFFTCSFLFIIAFACVAQEFVIIEGKRPHELNPQMTSYSSDSQLLTGLYEGLFSYNPLTLEPEFAIATGYKVSRDKKRWTITLREEAKFSNGEPVTAESVRDSWLQLLSIPDAPYASLLDIIDGAAAFRDNKCPAEKVGIFVTGEHTLSIKLAAPANYLPKVLCHSAFSVIHRIPTVYSGPYQLENQTENTYILKKNPYYWDEKNVSIEQITFLQSDDENENAHLFNTGMADWVTASVNADQILNKTAFQMGGEFGTSYYFFKLSSRKHGSGSGAERKENANVWDYAEFRNAVLEAVPWAALRGEAMVPATTFVYPLSGYNAPEGFDYTDVSEAKLMMDAARQAHKIPLDEEIPLVFEVSEFALSDAKKEIFKEALAPLGVRLEIRELPSYLYLGNVPVSDADLFAYTWIGDFADPLAFLELFRGGSSLNDSGWENAEYDALLESAAAASDYERNTLLSQAEKILLDSGMVIPVYHPVSFNLINLNETGGWASNAFDIHPLKYLFKKESKTMPANVVMR